MDKTTSYLFLERFKKGMSWTIALAVIGQNIFFFSVANGVGTLLTIVSWILVHRIIIQPRNFLHYTFSSFVVFGFYFTQFYLPLIFTLLEGKPLIYNLDFPISVFIHSFLAFIILLLSFIFYKNYINQIRSVLTNGLKKIKIYKIPTNQQIWLIGIIGVLSIVMDHLVFGGFGEGKENHVYLKLFAGLRVFAYLPLLLLFPDVFQNNGSANNFTSSKILIYPYIGVLILLGIMSNSRGLFMEGVTTIALIYFLGLLLGKIDYRVFSLKKILLISVGLWLVTGPLADLGTAMVVVRAVREDVSPKVLLQETVKVYKDKETLRRYKELADVSVGEWDERYFDNIFLARFSNLKFSDTSLKLAFQMPNPDEQIQDVVLGKYLSTLPQPMLNVLEFNLDKEFYTAASFGDFLFMRKTGVGYGGFKTGNFMGLGLASFGWWYLGVLFGGVIILYNFVDAFVLRTGIESSCISIVGFLSTLFCFTYFGNSTSSESVTTIFNYITRGWIQTVLLYVILFLIARKINRIF